MRLVCIVSRGGNYLSSEWVSCWLPNHPAGLDILVLPASLSPMTMLSLPLSVLVVSILHHLLKSSQRVCVGVHYHYHHHQKSETTTGVHVIFDSKLEAKKSVPLVRAVVCSFHLSRSRVCVAWKEINWKKAKQVVYISHSNKYVLKIPTKPIANYIPLTPLWPRFRLREWAKT